MRANPKGFDQWCAKNGIRLIPSQVDLAHHFMKYPNLIKFRGLGSGLSFLIKTVERFIRDPETTEP